MKPRLGALATENFIAPARHFWRGTCGGVPSCSSAGWLALTQSFPGHALALDPSDPFLTRFALPPLPFVVAKLPRCVKTDDSAVSGQGCLGPAGQGDAGEESYKRKQAPTNVVTTLGLHLYLDGVSTDEMWRRRAALLLISNAPFLSMVCVWIVSTRYRDLRCFLLTGLGKTRLWSNENKTVQAPK